MPFGAEIRVTQENETGTPADGPQPPSMRNPAGFIGSAMLPAIPVGLVAAAVGHWFLAEPVLVWAGLALAAANLVGFVLFVAWYRQRERRQRRDWQLRVWQHGDHREDE
jgi:hypothetical protein